MYSSLISKCDNITLIIIWITYGAKAYAEYIHMFFIVPSPFSKVHTDQFPITQAEKMTTLLTKYGIMLNVLSYCA